MPVTFPHEVRRSLVDKVVKGAIATAIAATETVEEVAESVTRNAISAALARPKRRSRVEYEMAPPRKRHKPPFKFQFQTLKNTTSGRQYRDEIVKHLQSYAILRNGGPLNMVGQIIKLPVDLIQYIMSFLRPTFAWHDRWKWPSRPHRALAIDDNTIRNTWLGTWAADQNQGHAYGYQSWLDERGQRVFSRFNLHAGYFTPAERNAMQAGGRWAQYNAMYNNLRRINNYRAPKPHYQVVGDSSRNALAWERDDDD